MCSWPTSPMAPSTALKACQACRQQKRKCSRELPACSLCVRLGKECSYGRSRHPEQPPSEGYSPVNSSLKPRCESFVLTPSNSFPIAFFLDQEHLTSPLATSTLASSRQPLATLIPRECLEPDRLAICARYFATIHTWLPIMSKKRIFHDLNEIPPKCDNFDELTTLCMKLCTSAPGNLPAEFDLYILARSLCSSAEAGGLICLQLIQCLVLLTVFEISHAIHPAAYLTIGRAARLGLLMGLNRGQTQPLFNPAETWSLREEQRRTWWAVFILERFIHLEPSWLPFATPEPGLGELLPISDDDWDNGKVVPSEPLYTTAFSSITKVGSFARLCQAAHMLSKVIQHKRARQQTQDLRGSLEEAKALHHALSALQSSITQLLLDGEALPDSLPASQAAFSVCVCARYLLYSLYACNEDPSPITLERDVLETEMQGLSLNGNRALSSSEVPDMVQVTSDCPLLAHCLYLTATECAWLLQEGNEPEMRNAFEQIVRALRYVGNKWAVGLEYLAFLDRAGSLKQLDPDHPGM